MSGTKRPGVLRCTAKYRKLFGLPERLEEPEVPTGSALGEWYANRLNAGPRRYLHYTSSLSRLAVIIPLRERHTAHQRFPIALADLLVHVGVPKAVADLECQTLLSLTFARATDRSVLGTMRDQSLMVRDDLAHGSVATFDLMVELADVPTGPLGYDHPARVAVRLLEAAYQRPRGLG